MELEGKAIEIEPGKTYAIEVESSFNPDIARSYAKMAEETTGAKFVFIMGGKIVRSNEHELREQIAQDIEAELCDTPNHGDFHQDWTHEVNTSALKLAAQIARGQK